MVLENFIFAFKNSIIILLLFILLLFASKKLKFKLSFSKTLFIVILFILQIIGDIFKFTKETTPSVLHKVSLALLFTFFLIILTSFLNAAISIILSKRKLHTGKFLFDLINAVIYIVGFFLILRYIFGINLTPLLATSAVLTIIIGLAVQDTIGNFISGISFHFDDSIKIGHWIDVDEKTGEIIDLSWRSVKIKTPDNTVIIIPNQVFTKKEFKNLSLKKAKVKIEVGVSYKNQPQNVITTIKKALLSTDGILWKPEPVVFVKEFSDFSINYEAYFNIKDFSKIKTVKSLAMEKIFNFFKREDIEIPYPIQTVYYKKEKKEDKVHKSDGISVDILKRFPLIKELSESSIEKLKDKSGLKFFKSGDVIIVEDTVEESLYLIVSGIVDVLKAGKKISEVKEGEIMGELSIFLNDKRSATCIAKSDVKLIEISGNDFKEIIKEEPNLNNKIENILKERIKKLNDIDADVKSKLLSRKHLLKDLIKKMFE